MKKNDNRVLGRVLAVEETRDVSGAKVPPHIGTEPDGGIETSCLEDCTQPTTSDQTLPGDDVTTTYADSGTAEDTGVILDCSTSRKDIASADPYCP